MSKEHYKTQLIDLQSALVRYWKDPALKAVDCLAALKRF